MPDQYDRNMPLSPMPGDAVVLTGEFSIAKPGDLGILDGKVGAPEEEYSIIFNCEGKAHRDYKVSCSGGPGTIATPTTELIYTGEYIDFVFWRWKDRPRKDGGEPYTLHVPLWIWRGESKDVDLTTEREIVRSTVAERMLAVTNNQETDDLIGETPAP